MDTLKKTHTVFDGQGRRVPFKGMRVFSEVSLWYYKLKQPQDSFEDILSRSRKHAGVDPAVTAGSFESVCVALKRKVADEPSLNGLFKGVHVPFICSQASGETDLGTELEKTTLPSVATSFKAAFPDLQFKATLQGSSRLSGELSVAEGSRYERFLESYKKGAIAGWYFPQALQEYDIASQRAQMCSLPLPDDLVPNCAEAKTTKNQGHIDVQTPESASRHAFVVLGLRHRGCMGRPDRCYRSRCRRS